ncbi:hypothetical protein CFR71_11695 [Novacetimonas pomaceti]|uniref:Uncharacterized protein n=1 Tax=Novacetimonas pomaceti TaxID=2021998 RepID=A0A318QQT1_9PROT|nr:hypothetical protein CFR71_11695 [Novacetimonas pomaceti]
MGAPRSGCFFRDVLKIPGKFLVEVLAGSFGRCILFEKRLHPKTFITINKLFSGTLADWRDAKM